MITQYPIRILSQPTQIQMVIVYRKTNFNYFFDIHCTDINNNHDIFKNKENMNLKAKQSLAQQFLLAINTY